MKTAVSIPNDLFKSADLLAKRMGVSRSELYTHAVRQFLTEHQSTDVTERLNRVYAGEKVSINPALLAMQVRSLPQEDW